VKRAAWAVVVALIACSTRSSRAPSAGPARPTVPAPAPVDIDRTIRVALSVDSPRVSATGDFSLHHGFTDGILARGKAGEEWRVGVAPDGHVTYAGPDGKEWQGRAFLIRATSGFVTVNGKRYRGELWVDAAGPRSVLIVNRVNLEDYLRSVVAAEMGRRPVTDSSALQAQAVASRSYAFVRLGSRGGFDIRSTVADQVYGGVDVENEHATRAVLATRGLVLRFEGRVVDALYSSTCGGSSAEGSEVFRAATPGYFRRVSDRIPGSSRYYCDIAPRFQWTRSYSRAQLDDVLARYLKEYASVPAGGPGRVKHLGIASTTPSGRVSVLDIETERGAFPVRGNDIRFVLRASPGGEMLNSTYFSVEPEYGRDGLLSRVTFRGRGYGHGVGMCQWGAIGRARAGQSFGAILGTYYPGTTIGPAVQ
jgi:stage II sporulation protein D